MQAKNAKKQNFFINLLSKTEEQKETKNAKAQNDSRGYAKNAQHFRISLVSHSVSRTVLHTPHSLHSFARGDRGDTTGGGHSVVTHYVLCYTTRLLYT